VLTFGLFVAADANAPERTKDPGGFSVHEWGTFTSIAGADGGALGWTPLNGRDDLPCFVDRIAFGPKWSLWGTVRMETPVLYFYAADDVTVDVKVRFNQGVITEWFPQAAVKPAKLPETPADGNRRLSEYVGTAAWTRVKVRPRAAADFPREDSPSHYYPARETDAAPVQVGNAAERFLFYRGVGEFAPPMNATVEQNGNIVLKTRAGTPIGDIVLFDNRGGTIRYAARRVSGHQSTINRAMLEPRSAASLNQQLERVLIAHGLYPKEASRLFYIAPRPAVDAVLPLDISPRPEDVVRVFVGRIELMTPETMTDMKSALLKNDQRTLAKYGRFLEPFMGRAFSESSAAEGAQMEAARQVMYRNWRPPLSACR
jgi:hypothetical protein